MDCWLLGAFSRKLRAKSFCWQVSDWGTPLMKTSRSSAFYLVGPFLSSPGSSASVRLNTSQHMASEG